MIFQYNDGGRAAAGFKGSTGDCVVRSIAIATGKPYKSVYNDLFELTGSSPRNGVGREYYQQYLQQLGWSWVPCMKIGSGCKIHLSPEELPAGTLIVRVTKHLTTVIDGVINDTHDCSRNGSRCVYGYFIKK